MGERHTGVVKWFNSKTGYGFITNCDTTEDVFVHHSQITTSGNVYKTLTDGEYVEYVPTVDDKNSKTLASDVTGIKKGPLLCERPRRNRPRKDRDGEEGDTGGD